MAFAKAGYYAWRTKRTVDEQVLAVLPAVRRQLDKADAPERDLGATRDAIEEALEAAIRRLPEPEQSAALAHFDFTGSDGTARTAGVRDQCAAKALGETTGRWYRGKVPRFYNLSGREYIVALVACALADVEDPLAYVKARATATVKSSLDSSRQSSQPTDGNVEPPDAKAADATDQPNTAEAPVGASRKITVVTRTRRRRSRKLPVPTLLVAGASGAVVVCALLLATLHKPSTSALPTGPAASPTSAAGWWPKRDPVGCGDDLLCGGTSYPALNRYVFENGARYPTGVPDERAFLSFASSSAGRSVVDPLNVAGEHQVKLVAIVDNAADPSRTADADDDGAEDAATAHDVRVSLLVPRGCRREQHVIGVISHHEDSGHSEQLTDSATLRASEPICVRLVPNTANFYNGYINAPLPDTMAQTYDPDGFDRRTISQNGPQLGCRQLDGRLYGSFKCAGYATAVLAVYRPGTKPDLDPPPRHQRAAIKASPLGTANGLAIRLSHRQRNGAQIAGVAGRFMATATITPTKVLQNATLELVLPDGAATDAPIGVRLHPATGADTAVHGLATLNSSQFVLPDGAASIKGPGEPGATPTQVVIPHANAGESLTVRWPLTATVPNIRMTFAARRPGGHWQKALSYSSHAKRIEWKITIDNGGRVDLDAPSLWLMVPSGFRLTGAPVVESPNGQRNTMYMRKAGDATVAEGEAVSLPVHGRATIRFAADDIATDRRTTDRVIPLVLQSEGYETDASGRVYYTNK